MLLHYFERLPWWRRLWHTPGQEYNSVTMPIEPTGEKLYTTKEAADITGLGEQQVRDVIRAIRIAAKKAGEDLPDWLIDTGRAWLIKASGLSELKPKKVGRPRIKKP